VEHCLGLLYLDDQLRRRHLYDFAAILLKDAEREVLGVCPRLGGFEKQGGLEQVLGGFCGADGLAKGGKLKEETGAEAGQNGVFHGHGPILLLAAGRPVF